MAEPTESVASQDKCAQDMIKLQNWRVFDLFHECMKYNLYPVVHSLENKKEESLTPVLGKRQRPDETRTSQLQSFSQSYLFIQLCMDFMTKEQVQAYLPDHLGSELVKYVLSTDG